MSTETRRAERTGRWPSVALILALACITPSLICAQEARLFVSSRAGDRLTRKRAVRFTQATSAQATFRLDPSVTHQTIVGFGASFLEAGMVCLNSLQPSQQEAVLRALFDPQNGAGFSAMKTVIAGTDFMSGGPWYSYADSPGDVELKSFSIARDLGPNGLVTYIRRARRYGHFILQAPMDYPPDWMLFDVEKNQDVDPRYFDTLARYYLRYLREYEKQGISIDYLSLFNEPGIYTKIPYRKIRDLLKNHVGPLFAREGVLTKLQLSEAPDRSNAYQNYPTVLDDPEARKYVVNLPFHGYRGGPEDSRKIGDLHRRYPDLPLWMTEVCHAYLAGTTETMKLPRYDFEDGDFWGNEILSDLESDVSAWIYWNLILDEKGGPWLVSPIHHNPDPNVEHPVVIVDRRTKRVTYTGLYYYLAHFSRFVRPGSIRIGVTGKRGGVRCVAFHSSDGDVVAQLLNSRSADEQVSVECGGRVLQLVLPAGSITTASWKPGS
ncbi:MAG TPA: glycoside hydrolase family 30 protein [Blastocatellia bacterium]|nr:glycoside hydrolase family 30 protein [Blastocatellia bacterium]